MSWSALARAVIGAVLTVASSYLGDEAAKLVVAAAGGALGGRDILSGARALIDATRRAAAGKESR